MQKVNSATVVVAKCSNAVNSKLLNGGTLTREDFDGGPISLDEIEPGLFLGNLSAATHTETLKSYKITHILTLDSVPLPQHILGSSSLTAKYVHIADMPKEDILHHLDECVAFIDAALTTGGTILVHCYFGVSRSSAAVIAYAMKRHNMDYNQAFEMVKSKRRFVQPNTGFITQLKLYKSMNCCIDAQYQRYKLYRLRLAGEKVRKAKILPQNFNNLIQPDPAITQENPVPIVYRCRKCRRILAAKSHVLAHLNKALTSTTSETYQIQQHFNNDETAMQKASSRLLDQIASQIPRVSLATEDTDDTVEQISPICSSILFVEPIAWMQNITHHTQGRLSCPKCAQKLGNFSWINGCPCPCGEEVTPAFYLIPSKIELSKVVQNVQTTV